MALPAGKFGLSKNLLNFKVRILNQAVSLANKYLFMQPYKCIGR